MSAEQFGRWTTTSSLQPSGTAVDGLHHPVVLGRSPVDAGWRAELEQPTTQVAVDAAGAVAGVVSSAIRPKDDTGQLLWLHCREDARTAEALISHVAALGPRPVHAFHFASALTLGLEALAVRHRLATAEVLERRAGFSGERLWRNMPGRSARTRSAAPGSVR